jgi:methyl-accepting chemotaxis protein
MSIKLKLSGFILFFIILLVGNAITINLWIEGAKDAGASINTAGRQRMLTQKMTKEAILATKSSEFDATLATSVKLFDESLKGLMNGDPELGIEQVKDHDARAQLDTVKKVWRVFQQELSQIEKASTAKAMSQLSQKSMSLLKESNKAVQLIQKAADDSNSVLRGFAIGFVLLTLIACAFAYLFVQKVLISRLNLIRDVSQRILNEKDLSLRIGLNGNDELDQATKAFDEMLASFGDMNKEVRQVESELVKIVLKISDTSAENQLSMDLQIDEIMMISTSMNEMASTVHEIARSTQNASDAATGSYGTAKKGNDILQENISLTRELASEIQQASDNIEKLVEASHSISGIANTITGIAEQTNLLALNAAIEAARAGEQGRGFAVVADEVRTLAQKTQEATSQIHSLIVMLNEATVSCVSAMRNSKDSSDNSVGQSEKLLQAFNEIIGTAESLSDINHQIAVATEEQSSVTEEMNHNIVRIEGQAQVTAKNIKLNDESARNLSVIAGQLRGQLDQFKS